MFQPANSAQFTISIPGAAQNSKVLTFQSEEAISPVFRFEIECVSERRNLDLETLLNQTAFLALGIHGEGHD